MQTDRNHNPARIVWIDGLRGIGCLCIFLHHFFLTYYPATFYGAAAASNSRLGLDTLVADLPFFFLLNGNFWVCIYLLIAGVMIMNKKLPEEKEHRFRYFIVFFIRRYLLLVFPIFLAEMLMFTGNLLLPDVIFPDIGTALPFAAYLKNAFWGTLFVRDGSVIGALWTMQAVFLGGLLILFIRLLFRNRVMQVLLLCLASAVFLQKPDWMYFVPVLAGGILQILFPVLTKYFKGWICVPVLVLGCFLAAFPSGLVPGGLYGPLYFGVYAYVLYHLLGAVMVVYAIGTLQPLQRLFTGRCVVWLGKISYPFYVFHIFVLKLTLPVFKNLNELLHSYPLQVLLTGAAALGLLFLLTELYRRGVDPYWKRAVNGLAGRLSGAENSRKE